MSSNVIFVYDNMVSSEKLKMEGKRLVDEPFFFCYMKQRRKRRKYYDWSAEIAKGNTDAFYNSTDWDILREFVLERDHHTCQFFLGLWNDGIHKPYFIKPIEATTVHHIIPIKERPDLALDPNNCVSLSHLAHEIIEDRHKFYFRKKKQKNIPDERWD